MSQHEARAVVTLIVGLAFVLIGVALGVTYAWTSSEAATVDGRVVRRERDERQQLFLVVAFSDPSGRSREFRLGPYRRGNPSLSVGEAVSVLVSPDGSPMLKQPWEHAISLGAFGGGGFLLLLRWWLGRASV